LNRDLTVTISIRSGRIGRLQLKEREKMNTNALIRPAWTPATIALMVIGFMVFWPLGLAMLAYIIWGDRLDGFKRDVNRATDGVFSGCRKASYRAQRGTGNVAFDDWREKELQRLDEERRRLDEMREEFDAYVRDLRRAKDQDEFDRFMANRSRSTPATTPKGRDKDPLDEA
jgi:hypothetical protein